MPQGSFERSSSFAELVYRNLIAVAINLDKRVKLFRRACVSKFFEGVNRLLNLRQALSQSLCIEIVLCSRLPFFTWSGQALSQSLCIEIDCPCWCSNGAWSSSFAELVYRNQTLLAKSVAAGVKLFRRACVSKWKMHYRLLIAHMSSSFAELVDLTFSWCSLNNICFNVKLFRRSWRSNS